MMDQAKIKISDQPWQQCDCGHLVFEERIMFKRISGILTGQSEAQYVPIPVIMCAKCNKVPSFMHDKVPPLPEEIKTKSLLSGTTGITGPTLL